MQTIRERNYNIFISRLNNMDLDIDADKYICEHYLHEEFTAEDFFDIIDEENGFEAEVIYFSDAMDYLSKNDPSLSESLEIAFEYGYSINDLNSEILASLLKTKRNRENFPTTDIQEILNDLDWDNYIEDSEGEQYVLTDENIIEIGNNEFGEGNWKVENDIYYFKTLNEECELEWEEICDVTINRKNNGN